MVLHSHGLTLSWSYALMVLRSHGLTLSWSYTLTVLHSHGLTLARSYTRTVLHSHSLTLSHISEALERIKRDTMRPRTQGQLNSGWADEHHGTDDHPQDS